MKKQKATQEQINVARQKRFKSSEFKSTTKRLIESLKIFNNTRTKNPLSQRDMKELAFYFADRSDFSAPRTREKTSLESTLDEIQTKK